VRVATASGPGRAGSRPSRPTQTRLASLAPTPHQSLWHRKLYYRPPPGGWGERGTDRVCGFVTECEQVAHALQSTLGKLECRSSSSEQLPNLADDLNARLGDTSDHVHPDQLKPDIILIVFERHLDLQCEGCDCVRTGEGGSKVSDAKGFLPRNSCPTSPTT
jgi:hypothetical protein